MLQPGRHQIAQAVIDEFHVDQVAGVSGGMREGQVGVGAGPLRAVENPGAALQAQGIVADESDVLVISFNGKESGRPPQRGLAAHGCEAGEPARNPVGRLDRPDRLALLVRRRVGILEVQRGLAARDGDVAVEGDVRADLPADPGEIRNGVWPTWHIPLGAVFVLPGAGFGEHLLGDAPGQDDVVAVVAGDPGALGQTHGAGREADAVVVKVRHRGGPKRLRVTHLVIAPQLVAVAGFDDARPVSEFGVGILADAYLHYGLSALQREVALHKEVHADRVSRKVVVMAVYARRRVDADGQLPDARRRPGSVHPGVGQVGHEPAEVQADLAQEVDGSLVEDIPLVLELEGSGVGVLEPDAVGVGVFRPHLELAGELVDRVAVYVGDAPTPDNTGRVPLDLAGAAVLADQELELRRGAGSSPSPGSGTESIPEVKIRDILISSPVS